jgi:hypothetical protein
MAQFDQLSDLDFEEFVADLISAETGLKFRVGARGRDGGIDARAADGERTHVIQCKHFVESPVSKLSSAARTEAKKLAALTEPYATYRFATSKPLSDTAWESLVKILRPWLDAPEHVLGGNDLARILRAHPKVERGHPKLWFSGAGQLRRALSAESYERREALIDEIHPRAPRYVETDVYRKARRRLHKNQVIVIDGPAGVGKTTLAQLLLLECLERGCELFEVVPGSLGKAWELLENDEKQVFYFDDFLGHTTLFAQGEHDRDLIRFIRRIAGDGQRRLILTTRDYILVQAKERSEALNREVDEAHLFDLTGNSYSRIERARILYNHVYFSEEVDATARASLISGGHHIEVIDHHGYSPRIIEAITGYAGHRLTAEEKADYGRFCIEALDAPKDLWGYPFEQGLGDHERALVLSFLGLIDRVRLDLLETAFEATCAARGLATIDRRFQRALTAVLGSFVTRVEGFEGRPMFSLANASLIDYLEIYVRSSRADAEALLRGASVFDQATWAGHAIFDEREETPPESLRALFGQTLDRLFESRPQINFSYLDDDPEWKILDDRLGEVVPFCVHPWFRDACTDWLPRRVRAWLAHFDGDDELFDRDELGRLLDLLECELIDPVSVAEKARASIASLEPGYPRELLDRLARLCPETIDSEFVADQEMALEEYVDAVVAEPARFHATEELDDLARVLSTWGMALDDNEWKRVSDQIEIARAEEEKELEKAGELDGLGFESWGEHGTEGRREDDGTTERPGGGNEDGEIEAMFARLLGENARLGEG